MSAARAPATERTLLLSSVPLLGPRLSLLESLMLVIPRMQKYEDDLRDQWQSRAHREEWRRMLTTVLDMVNRGPVNVLSGEIHLAGRATMEGEARRTLHQLVASGIAHPAPPRAWARILGALATLGESPLPGRAITFRRIPGQSQRYIADRNFLVLARKSGAWSARWEFETRGLSPPLDL